MKCPFHASLPARCAAFGAALLLAACGGGGGDGDGGVDGTAQASDCSVEAQKGWLAGYMDEWYFWNRLAPRPDPAGFAGIDAYFSALRYAGSDPSFPADRWSGSQSTASYERFYGDGQALGYGVSVAGIEVTGQPSRPLYVRYVEPRSPAGAAGVRRGDEVLALNGRSAAELIAGNDFAALTAAAAGETLSLRLRAVDGQERSLVLTAAVHALTPVAPEALVTSPGGRRLGYLFVKDMLDQATPPLEGVFTRLRAGTSGAGAGEVVLDLRYNGGGLVSVGATLASYLAGPAGQGQTYASLIYNDRRAATNNTRFAFSAPAQALPASRVYVLTGPRTCSAAEQLISGLQGIGVDVVTIGDGSCGKPVGFLPTARCGTTYSIVNFESVNARGEGRYFDGIPARCRVDEDFRQPLGSPADPLLAAALQHADTGACPAAAADTRARPLRVHDGGDAPGMLGR